MDGCLTRQQVDVFVWVILAASTLALAATIVAVAMSLNSGSDWRTGTRPHQPVARLPLLVLSAGLAVFLVVQGQVWAVTAALPAVAFVVAVRVGLPDRSAEGPGSGRSHVLARNGVLAVAACSAVVAVASAAWAVPAGLCG